MPRIENDFHGDACLERVPACSQTEGEHSLELSAKPRFYEAGHRRVGSLLPTRGDGGQTSSPPYGSLKAPNVSRPRRKSQGIRGGEFSWSMCDMHRADAGGCPAASHFLLLVQKKVTKENDPRMQRPLRDALDFSIESGGCGTSGRISAMSYAAAASPASNSPRRKLPIRSKNIGAA